jgi:hypothetical protein
LVRPISFRKGKMLGPARRLFADRSRLSGERDSARAEQARIPGKPEPNAQSSDHNRKGR